MESTVMGTRETTSILKGFGLSPFVNQEVLRAVWGTNEDTMQDRSSPDQALEKWLMLLPPEISNQLTLALKQERPFLPPDVTPEMLAQPNALVPSVNNSEILYRCLDFAMRGQNFEMAAALVYLVDRACYRFGRSATLLSIADEIMRVSPQTPIAPQVIVRKARVMKDSGDLHSAWRILDSVINKERAWGYKDPIQFENTKAAIKEIKGQILHLLGLRRDAIPYLVEAVQLYQSVNDRKGTSSTLSTLSRCINKLGSEDYNEFRRRYPDLFPSEHPCYQAYLHGLMAVRCVEELGATLYVAKHQLVADESLLMFAVHQQTFSPKPQLFQIVLQEMKQSLAGHRTVHFLHSVESFFEFVHAVFMISLTLAFSPCFQDMNLARFLEKLAMELYAFMCLRPGGDDGTETSLNQTRDSIRLMNGALALLELPLLESTDMIINQPDRAGDFTSMIKESENDSRNSSSSSSSSSSPPEFASDSSDQLESPNCNNNIMPSLSESFSNVSVPRSNQPNPSIIHGAPTVYHSELLPPQETFTMNQSELSNDDILISPHSLNSDINFLSSQSEPLKDSLADQSKRSNIMIDVSSNRNEALKKQLPVTTRLLPSNQARFGNSATFPTVKESGIKMSASSRLKRAVQKYVGLPVSKEELLSASCPLLASDAMTENSDAKMSSKDVDSLTVSVETFSSVSFRKHRTHDTSSFTSSDTSAFVSCDTSSFTSSDSSSFASCDKSGFSLNTSSFADLSSSLLSCSNISSPDSSHNSSPVSSNVSRQISSHDTPLVSLSATTLSTCASTLPSVPSEESRELSPLVDLSKSTVCSILSELNLGDSIVTSDSNEFLTHWTPSSDQFVYRAQLWTFNPLTGDWLAQTTMAYIGAQLNTERKGSYRDTFRVSFLHQDEPLGRYVGKRYRQQRKIPAYMNDVMCQMIASVYVFNFNQALQNCPEDFLQVQFLTAAHLRLININNEVFDWINVEPFLQGSFEKLTNNLRFVSSKVKDERGVEVATALSHFSYKVTDGRLMIVDLQGWLPSDGKGVVYLTDPVFHTRNSTKFSPCDLQEKGMRAFWEHVHPVCNRICKFLELDKCRPDVHSFDKNS